jgi:hypothetical protein
MPGGPCVDEAPVAHSVDVPMCLPLLIGSVMGVPMRPEQFEELLQSAKQQKVADIIPDESENGDGTITSVHIVENTSGRSNFDFFRFGPHPNVLPLTDCESRITRTVSGSTLRS